MTVHVERRVVNLRRIVVVAEHRVELDAGVEQRLVGLLEFQAIVFRRRRSLVNVVTTHQHEAEIEPLAIGLHLRGDCVLLRRSASAVADDGELDGQFLVRKRQRVRRNVARRHLGDHIGAFTSLGDRIATGGQKQETDEAETDEQDLGDHRSDVVSCRIRTVDPALP